MIEEKIKRINLETKTGLSDVIFKGIMYPNDDILRAVLNISLEEELGLIRHLNNELPVLKFIEKGKKLDLYLEEENMYIDIEVTENYNVMIVNRNIGYLSKMYTDTVCIGDDYSDYKEVKIINLIGNKKNKNIKEIYNLKNQEGKVLSEKLIYGEIYIQNLVELWYNKNNKAIEKYKYLIMLGLNKKELNKFNQEYGDDIVNKYTEQFNKIITSKAFEPLFDREEDERRMCNSIRKMALKEGIEQGIEQGMEQGIEEGKNKKQIEIAKKMLEKGISYREISEITGLTIEELENLK